MEKKHRQHLKTRLSPPFNILSKAQEDTAKSASVFVWDKINEQYPDYEFSNLVTLGLKDFNTLTEV